MRIALPVVLAMGLGFLGWVLQRNLEPEASPRPVQGPAGLIADSVKAPQLAAGRPESVAAIAQVSPRPIEPADGSSIAGTHAAISPATAVRANCLAQASPAKESGSLAIHRWTDSHGIIHFSDTAPQGAVQAHRRIEVEGAPPVRVEARGYDVNLPEALAQRAVADALAIQRILRDSLDVEDDGVSVLQIEFIASPAAFAERTGNTGASQAAGSYSMRDHTIRVLMQPDAELNFRILRHEITHALIHERVGVLPTALNEGLAGFFENLRVSGMGGQVIPAHEMRGATALLPSGDPAAALISLFAHADRMFYGPGQEARYAQAFALIAQLMGSEDGRSALAAVLRAQRQAPCESADVVAILEAEYPGGLSTLGTDWLAWMRNPPDTVIAY